MSFNKNSHLYFKILEIGYNNLEHGISLTQLKISLKTVDSQINKIFYSCFKPISPPPRRRLHSAVDNCDTGRHTNNRVKTIDDFIEDKYVLKAIYISEYSKTLLMKTHMDDAKKTAKISRVIALIALLISLGILALNFYK